MIFSPALRLLERAHSWPGSANPVLIQGLKALLGDTSHIVFGTDIPFGDGMAIVNGLKSCALSADEMRGVDRENAVRPKYQRNHCSGGL